MNEGRHKSKESRILQAAVSVFAEKGYHGSSIADIAGAARVATGTIYLYFAHKEDLLTALFQRTLGRYLEEHRSALESAPPGLPQLRKLVEVHLRFFERDMDLARVFQIHLREVNPVIRDGIRPTLVEYLEMIDGVVRAGVRAGDFETDLDPRLARQFLFGGLDELVTAWVVSGGGFPLVSVTDRAFRMLALAFGARRARIEEALRS